MFLSVATCPKPTEKSIRRLLSVIFGLMDDEDLPLELPLGDWFDEPSVSIEARSYLIDDPAREGSDEMALPDELPIFGPSDAISSAGAAHHEDESATSDLAVVAATMHEVSASVASSSASPPTGFACLVGLAARSRGRGRPSTSGRGRGR